MQYKIPVQIENEDPILLWLSLRQLTIVMIWWSIWYSLFKAIAPSVWVEIAAIPSLFIAGIAFAIAKFKIAEMSFVKFILSFVQLKVNIENRHWLAWVDSYQPIDIWHVTQTQRQTQEKVSFEEKKEKINQLKEKINNL